MQCTRQTNKYNIFKSMSNSQFSVYVGGLVALHCSVLSLNRLIHIRNVVSLSHAWCDLKRQPIAILYAIHNYICVSILFLDVDFNHLFQQKKKSKEKKKDHFRNEKRTKRSQENVPYIFIISEMRNVVSCKISLKWEDI